jgi:hypothetical protein
MVSLSGLLPCGCIARVVRVARVGFLGYFIARENGGEEKREEKLREEKKKAIWLLSVLLLHPLHVYPGSGDIKLHTKTQS